MTDEAETNAVRKFKTPELRIKKQRRPAAADPPQSGGGNSSADSSGPSSPAAKPAEPTIHVIRQDGLVQSIKVECGCGQLIELNCVYDPTPDAAQAAMPAPGSNKARKPAATHAKAVAATPAKAPTAPRADAAEETRPPSPTATPPTDSETRG